MLKWSALLAFACLMLVTGAIALNAAAEKPEKEAKPATQAATQTAPNTTPVNKKCPISGDDIDPKGKTVTYKGKTIAFCCDDCIEKFNKNPEKYVANLK
jgi:YHS domain-containing protein